MEGGRRGVGWADELVVASLPAGETHIDVPKESVSGLASVTQRQGLSRVEPLELLWHVTLRCLRCDLDLGDHWSR